MTGTATTPVSEPLGDPLPAVLAAHYDAIDGDRFEEAAATFGPGGLYAVALPGVVETGPRTETVGPAALLERLIERGPKPWRHVLSLCVVDRADALVEGVVVADTGVAISSFVGSARLSGDGLLERYLALSCPGAGDPIPIEVGAATVPADAATVVRRYFTALDAGRFAEAASHFSDDVLYSHPPYQHTGIDDPDRIEFRGRATLRRRSTPGEKRASITRC